MLGRAPDGSVAPPGLLRRPADPSHQPVNALPGSGPGSLRFGHGEGFNGSAVKRFKLFKTKGYLWNDVQAELHCVMVFCAQHGLTQRRRELEATGEFRLTIPKKQRVAQAEADALAASGLAPALAA